ncbi:MAG: hypothetical protein IPK50_02025 [Fibrobacterota bacterium]|nr:hypothetical protein [Fibrobacterota bacterium]QQS05677.1 MAG: hypothetical protein IPK50_02025 [Fibrobacterota bacterium]
MLAIDSLLGFETAPTKVFSFEVEGVHNYLVGSLGIAVHNTCTQPGGGGSKRADNKLSADPAARGDHSAFQGRR